MRATNTGGGERVIILSFCPTSRRRCHPRPTKIFAQLICWAAAAFFSQGWHRGDSKTSGDCRRVSVPLKHFPPFLQENKRKTRGEHEVNTPALRKIFLFSRQNVSWFCHSLTLFFVRLSLSLLFFMSPIRTIYIYNVFRPDSYLLTDTLQIKYLYCLTALFACW